MISIHVPRAGYDSAFLPWIHPTKYFYPRTPCGVRPVHRRAHAANHEISIHVPRAGYDIIHSAGVFQNPVFLSTYPVRGTTLLWRCEQCGETLFLSTYPVRGTT